MSEKHGSHGRDGSHASHGSHGSRNKPTSLLVTNLPPNVERRQIGEMFEKHGPIRDIHIPLDYHSRRPRGFAFVEFEEDRSARHALRALNGERLCGQTIYVKQSRSNRKTPEEMGRQMGPGNGRMNMQGRGRQRPWGNGDFRQGPRNFRDNGDNFRRNQNFNGPSGFRGNFRGGYNRNQRDNRDRSRSRSISRRKRHRRKRSPSSSLSSSEFTSSSSYSDSDSRSDFTSSESDFSGSEDNEMKRSPEELRIPKKKSSPAPKRRKKKKKHKRKKKRSKKKSSKKKRKKQKTIEDIDAIEQIDEAKDEDVAN